MIPIRDANPSSGTPVVTYAIIVSCTVAFLFQLSMGGQLQSYLLKYGLVPAYVFGEPSGPSFGGVGKLIPFFSSVFLHGGWLHLIGNMWILNVFGDNVESYLGHARYFVFYILSGILAGVIHVLTSLGSTVPTIGASGAVAGVMGAYFVLYPRARVLTFVPIFFFFTLMELPAYVFLGFWFLLQFFSGTFSLLGGEHAFSGIAWWAHIGGFLGGIGLLKVLAPPRRYRSDNSFDYWR
ncbi:MAG: rhomboid family intramembrane serine protease [Syntrophobacteraceae bacterium]